MRILALSDIHGNLSGIDAALAEAGSIDLLVLAGDITTRGTAEQTQDALRRAGTAGTPVIAITGNMDPPLLEETLAAGNAALNGRGLLFNGVGFFGISASPFSPLHTPNEVDEAELQRRAETGWADVRSAARKVMVSHTPPKDTAVDRLSFGPHVGSTAVRKFIELHGPDLVICGHIHEARGMDTLGKTLVVNCGPLQHGYYAVVEIPETGKIEVELRKIL